jgi:hypothetical protein
MEFCERHFGAGLQRKRGSGTGEPGGRQSRGLPRTFAHEKIFAIDNLTKGLRTYVDRPGVDNARKALQEFPYRKLLMGRFYRVLGRNLLRRSKTRFSPFGIKQVQEPYITRMATDPARSPKTAPSINGTLQVTHTGWGDLQVYIRCQHKF